MPPIKEQASSAKREAQNLQELTPQQWKSGIAAWLGWLFDGLDMHLYTLVAAPFVMQLVAASSVADPQVKQYSSWIQAAFLIGWALGGGFFGRVGDLLGRSRALSLTIITYALFTGLSSFAQTWWHLLMFRFLAALGIGGEWAVGSSLLSETWPKRWGPWIAAVLQSGSTSEFACLVTTYLWRAEPVGFSSSEFSAGAGVLDSRAVQNPRNGTRPRPKLVKPRCGICFGDVFPSYQDDLVCSLTLAARWAFNSGTSTFAQSSGVILTVASANASRRPSSSLLLQRFWKLYRVVGQSL
jgi:hypothetical protein